MFPSFIHIELFQVKWKQRKKPREFQVMERGEKASPLLTTLRASVADKREDHITILRNTLNNMDRQ